MESTSSIKSSNLSDLHWKWEEICGPDGLHLWSPVTHDLGICFQQLCLQIPVLSVLAITSAYYFGRHINYVLRNNTQLTAINMRCVVITFFAILPILQTYSALESNDDMFSIFYLLSGVQALAWISHLGYAIILRTRLSLSSRGPIFVGVLWSLLAVLSVIFLRSNINIYKRSINPDNPIYISLGFSIASVIFHVAYAITLIPSEGAVYIIQQPQMRSEREPLLSSLTAFGRLSEDQDPHHLGVAMEDVPFLSKLLFHWVNPLMQKGCEERLTHPDDLYDLPDSLNSACLSRKFDFALLENYEENANEAAQRSASFGSESSIDVIFPQSERKTSLIRALHRCFAFQFYGIGILKFTSDCSAFAGPMLLNRLVSFLENKDDDIRLGYLYAGGLFLSSLIGALCNAHFNFLMSIVGLKIRASLVTKIYKKTLSVGGTALNSAFSVGEIVNFMSTDTDRVVNSCPSFHSLWSIPLQLGITLYLLYQQVGLAFLAGVSFSIILIPINRIIAKKIGDLSSKLMEKKDNRVKIMTEVLRGIRSIKLYVWEGHFIRLITKIREEELKYLKGRKYLDALCVYFWATTPVLISILTFTTYVMMGNQLTAATVFTSMALLNMLIGPLNAFPWVLNGITEAWVSISRIQRLLDLPDLDLSKYYDPVDEEENAVVIKNGIFNWNKLMSAQEKNELHSHSQSLKGKGKGKKSRISESGEASQTQLLDFYLHNINTCVKRGEFVGVMGSVGSGKSSILNAVMAELTKQGGQIAVADLERGFGYVSQQPWIQRGTVRDNVLFGRNYDENKYVSVVQACGLTEDFQTWPNADLTGVGEAGMTLSGGQKARVALARAVYQDKQIYLLDDILSAVDVQVAKHIFQNCIMGLLKGKTIIFCCHSLQYLLKTDKIIVMENGYIQKQGRPEDILSEAENFLNIDLDSLNTQSSLVESIRSDPDIKGDNNSILNEETHESGNIQIGVYTSYWKAIGHLLSISILLSILLMQSSRNMTDWWLSYWVTNAESNSSSNYSTTKSIFLKNSSMYTTSDYLTIYAIFAVSNTIFTLFRAFLFAYGGITAACKVHKLLLKSIVRAKITFFDISPLGRILNRFSSDTYTIDDSLPFILNILLAQFFGLLGSITITLYGLPWLSLILVPLFPIYNWLQSHYRLTSRELKRLSSVTLSPVYSHFNESLQGLSTIRAFRTMKRFRHDNEENVEMNQKAQFASQAAAQWLSLRLQFIGVALVTGVGLLAVIQHQFDVADPGLVGLAISYALSVTGLLNGVVNAFTETEREMIAVERVNQYTEEVTPEKATYIIDPPYAWPSQGVISFNNVSLKYRDHLVPSLNNICFETRPAEKIGVVGRTGAGKSSLLVSLFRLVELSGGNITIDSVNISHISVAALRSRLSCIPQEPFLFSGTVRENLDPLNEFRDSEIWSALGKVDLTPKIRQLGGLQYLITSGGSNLSVGQRQLFCLARALLHNAKILCIDEATANVDPDTDRKIQQALRSSFRKSTVITIAHRIQTIMDCDRVLVMSAGNAIEFDNPEALLNDSNSQFYQLANQE